MGKLKKSCSGRFRHIHAYFGIFSHIQACSEIIQTYPEPYVTLTYSEPWYIQNQKPRHIQNPVKYLQFSVFQKMLRAAVVFTNYFCNISFSHCLIYLKTIQKNKIFQRVCLVFIFV